MQTSRTVMAGAGVPIEVIRYSPDHRTAKLVLIHGWGEAAESLTDLGAHFARVGYDTAIMSMRGWGQSGGEDDCGLQQPDDVVAIARAVRAWLPDTKLPVFLCGISQGGQVALLAAARDRSLVTAVAGWAPVTDVGRWRQRTTNKAIANYIDRTCADGNLQERSPLSKAHQLSVPVLLVHGAADDRVPIEQSHLLNNALKANGGHCFLEALPEVGHGGPEARRRAFVTTTTFFDSLRTDDHTM